MKGKEREGGSKNVVKELGAKRDALVEGFKAWAVAQPPFVEVGMATLGGCAQGGVLGAVMGNLAKAANPPGSPQASANPLMATQMSPMVQAKSFAVLSGVHSGLNVAMRKARGGVEDVKNLMVASFGAGVAFTLASGQTPPGQNLAAAALTTGVVFSVLQGGMHQIGKKLGFGKKKEAAGSASADDSASFFFRCAPQPPEAPRRAAPRPSGWPFDSRPSAPA